MRKSSKILALILTFAMLLGALAIGVLATEEEIESPSPVLNMSNAAGTIVPHKHSSGALTLFDFEDVSFDMHWDPDVKTGTVPLGLGVATQAKNFGHASTKEYMGNTYMAFWFDKTAANAYKTTEGSANWDSYIDTYLADVANDVNNSTAENLTTNSLSMPNALVVNDYVVLDWDLCADGYLDPATGNLLDAYQDGAVLSYPVLNMSLGVRAGINSYTHAVGSSAIKVTYGKLADGDFYMTGSDASQRKYLSTNINEWQHVTVVIEIDNRIDITLKAKDAAEGDLGTPKTGIKFMEAVALLQTEEFGSYSDAEAKSFVINNAYNYQLFNSKLHMFMNGEHFSTTTFLYSQTMDESGKFFVKNGQYISPAHYQFYNIRMGVSGFNAANAAANSPASFSAGFDNLATHYYKSGYADSTEGSRTLNAYMTSKAYESGKNLAYCDDVVYNADYLVPNPNTPVASVKVGDVTTDYYTKQGAEDAIVENATLIIPEGTKFENFIVTTKFMVQMSDPSAFTIYNSDEYSIVPSSTENLYVIKSVDELSSVYYTVYDFPFEEWGEQDSIEEGQFVPGQIPGLQNPELFTVPLTEELNPEMKDGRFRFFTGWYMYYAVGEDEYEAEDVVYDEIFEGYYRLAPVSALTEEMVTNNQYNGIFLFPAYETEQFAFSVLNTATGELVAGIDYTDGSDVAENVNNAIANAGTYVVTLYKDVFLTQGVAARTSINVNAGVTLYFDLNGNDYVISVTGKGGNFSVQPEGTLYIYSTKEGGRMFNFNNQTSYANGGTMLSLAGATDPAKASKVYLGKVDATVNGYEIKADGNNLWMSAAILADTSGVVAFYNVYEADATTKIPVDKNGDGFINDADKLAGAQSKYGNLYIDGGTYTRPNPDGGGFIKASCYTNVEINNALLIGYQLFSTDSRYNPKMTGTVNNSVLVASGANNSVFGQFCDGSSLTMTNTTIAGNMYFGICTYAGYNITDPVATAGGAWKYENGCYNYVGAGNGTLNLHPMSAHSILGKVYLGEGCKTTGAHSNTVADGKSGVRAADGVNVVDINESYNIPTIWYKPLFQSGAYVEGSIDTAENITVKRALTKGYTAKNDTATINWKSATGEALDTNVVPVIGPVFYADGLMPEKELDTVAVPGTDLFMLGINRWTMNGSDVPATLTVSAGDVIDFTAVMGMIAPEKTELAPAKQMFETTTKFTGIFFVPFYDAAEIVVGDATYVISASQIGGAATTHHETIDGVKYMRFYTAYPSAIDLGGGATSKTLTYTVTKMVGGEAVETLDVSFSYASFTLGVYLEKALTSADDVKTKKLMANCIQYCLESCRNYFDVLGTAYKGAQKSSRERLEAFVTTGAGAEAYAAYRIDIDSEAFDSKIENAAAKTTLPAGLEKYVESIIYYNAGGAPTLALVPVKNVVEGEVAEGDVENIKMAYLYAQAFGAQKSHSLGVAVAQNSGYKNALGETLAGQRNSGNLGYFMDVNGHLYTFYLNNTLRIVLVTCEAKDGVETPTSNDDYKTIVFEYCLSDGIVELETKGDATSLSYARTLRALAAYSEASVDYLTEVPAEQ